MCLFLLFFHTSKNFSFIIVLLQLQFTSMPVVKSLKEFNKKITSVMFVEMEVVPILTSMIQVIHFR